MHSQAPQELVIPEEHAPVLYTCLLVAAEPVSLPKAAVVPLCVKQNHHLNSNQYAPVLRLTHAAKSAMTTNKAVPQTTMNCPIRLLV